MLAGAISVLLLWLAVKVELFRNLEYYGSDFFSFLQMSQSFRYTGRLLWENVYGNHAAIHNFYGMLLYFPLTYLLGGYGLILGLWAVYVLGAVAAVRTPVLPRNGKIAVLAVLLSPIGFWVFDDAEWGFHPELWYAPLGLLLSLRLLERRYLAAGIISLVVATTKEDAPAVIAAVLLPFFFVRFREGHGDPTARRRVLGAAAICLGATAVAFAVGLAFLHTMADEASDPAVASTARLRQSLVMLEGTLQGRGLPDWAPRLWRHLGGFTLVALCGAVLAPRRLAALSLTAVSGTLLAPVLLVSGAGGGFGLLFWPPRVATFLAAVLACMSVAATWPAPDAPSTTRGDGASLPAFLVLVAAVWAAQAAFLAWYPIPRYPDLGARLNPGASRRGLLRPAEAEFASCLADRLPRDFPVESTSPHAPLFHRQAIIFPERREFAWTPARMRVALGGDDAGRDRLGRVDRILVTGDRELASLVNSCVTSVAAPDSRVRLP